MAEHHARRGRSLLARLLRRRPAETGAASQAGSAHSAPLLLDQVSSRELMRLASDRLGPDIHRPAPGAAATAVSARTGRPGLRSLLLRTVLPLAFLGLGTVMVAGLSFGTVTALTDEDGVSGADILRLAVMGLAGLTVVSQGLAVSRSLPGGKRLAAQAARLWRGLTPAGSAQAEASIAGDPLLLDQVSSQQLIHLAPEYLGRVSALASARRTGWRAAEDSSWIALVLAVMALAALTVAGLGFAVIRSLTGGGGFGAGVVLQLVFMAMAVLGVVFLGITALRSLADRRKRRRRRLLMRLFRYLLRLFRRGKSAAKRAPAAAFGDGAIPSRLAVAALATATVAGLAFVPSLTEGGGDGAVVVAGSTSTPVALGIATTPVPSPAGSDPSPFPGGEPGSTPSPDTTVAGGAEDASAGQQPGPEGGQSGDDLASPPTSTPQPALTPAPAPKPAPAPTPAPMPSPSVDLVSVSATLRCSSTVIVRISNRGPDDMAETAMVTVEVTLERRTIITKSATKTIQLEAGSAEDFSVDMGVTLGRCRGGPAEADTVRVVVDSADVLAETNEGNNSRPYTLTSP